MFLRPLPSSFRPATRRHSSSSKSSRRHSSASRGGGSVHRHLLASISICAACKNSPSAATLDLLILLLALFCSTFLVGSSLAHVFRSLALLLSAASFRNASHPYLVTLLLLFLAASLVVAVLSYSRPCFFPWFFRRRCGRPRCRGLKKALEFDVQLQTEECIRSPDLAQTAAWKEIDDLPWKGEQQGNNPDYECLRVELRRMAPSNGRAVLLFRARCGCPLAKLEAWGPKRSRRNKK
ncbi:uncharacterized protein At5g19025-like [Curcuma longa]|uniref:uncharacterized protein At5g19025-like n=1 Tax=Curcuma longa TaxID=136217 RepID=UPI003D9DBCDB